VADRVRARNVKGPPRGRLSRSAEFERVYRHGRSTANRHVIVYVFPNAGSERVRVGMSVSRKVGGAVERNRVKRLLRETLAARGEDLVAGHDIVVVARPATLELAEREGLKGVEGAVVDVLERAGLLGAARTPGESA
jgi:ribonuclease P protein component